ncbi:MAG: cell division protein FtsQ [Acidobacteriota bacterium]|nr:cell division protein FtsQ [Acidobacteriota bacterium]
MSVAPILPAPEEFRRSGAPPRRRRRNPIVALLRPLAVSLLLVAMPASLVTWVLASSRFNLAEVIVVAGTPRIPAEVLRKAVAPFEGANLILLPLDSVEAAVRRNPWVDTVEVAKELPDRLRVKVTERRPVALLVRDIGNTGLVYADQKGRPIAPVEDPERARKGGLVVVVFTHPQLSPSDGVGGALEVAGELGRVQPSWAGALSKIEVLGEQDFRLHTGSLRFPLLVTRGQVGPKVKRLIELLPELDRRYPAIQAVDLRFSRRIVVQPAAPVPQRSGPELRS